MTPHAGGLSRAVAVIPARFGSTRLPGKPLAHVAGRPLIAHVVERARGARRIQRVIVATDHEGIAAAARAAGAEAMLTRPDHPTGSDRIGELLPQLDCEIIVNLQGDEPEVDPLWIDLLVDALEGDPMAAVATPSAPFPAHEDPTNPHRVKVVRDLAGRALWFSRSLIPFPRGAISIPPRLHIGIYAFRREALAKFLTLERGPLERTEELEQLRYLEHGMAIRVVEIAAAPGGGVDTQDDLEAFRLRRETRRADEPSTR